MTASRRRRQPLTIMFCDMVGSTRLSQRLDVEMQATLVGKFHADCRDAIRASGGIVAQYLGDGVLAYFGYPVLREQDVGNALAAALAIREMHTRQRADGLPRTQVRIGIATGLVLIGDLDVAGVTQELAAIGPATNLAARLQGLAEPQGIAICAETKRLLRGTVKAISLGPQFVKGIDNEIEAFSVIALEQGGGSRADGHRLVGRQVELAWLDQLASGAAAGQGAFAIVESEPGLGKSRLLREFVRRLSAKGFHHRAFSGSESYVGRPYWPLLEALRGELSVGGDAPADSPIPTRTPPVQPDMMQKLASALQVFRGDEVPVPADPATIQATLLDWFLGLGAGQQTLVLFEDIHWYDPSTLAWLELLARSIPDRNILVLCTTRPREALSSRPLSFAPSLRLAPMRPDESEELLAACDPLHRINEKTREWILDQAAGVPLLIEELAEAARTRKDLAASGGRGQPVSLTHGLLARIAAVDGAEPVCTALAVAGVDLGAEMIASVCDLSVKDAADVLDRLVSSGLLTESGLPRTFGFRHSLLRDAMYETIMVEARGPLHGRVAAALSGTASAEPALLARHHALAGNHAAAAAAWREAGERAVRSAAHSEASESFRKALTAVGQMAQGDASDRLELSIQTSLGLGLLGGEGYAGEAPIAALERARMLMQRLGEFGSMSAVLTSLTAALFNRAEYRRSLEIREEHLILAEIEGDPAGLCVAHRGVATIYNIFGQFEAAQRHAAKAWSCYDFRRDGPRVSDYPTDIGTAAAIQLALALWHRGQEDEARRMIKTGLAIASQLDHKNSLGYALTYALIFEGFMAADYPRARDYARRLQTLGDTFAMPQWSIWARCSSANFDAHLGDPVTGLQALKEGLSRRDGLRGNRGLGALFHVGVGDVLLLAGKAEAARTELGRAAAFAVETGEVWMESLRLMIEARAHHALGAREEATLALAEAARVAAAQGSVGMAGRVSRLAAEFGLPVGLFP